MPLPTPTSAAGRSWVANGSQPKLDLKLTIPVLVAAALFLGAAFIYRNYVHTTVLDGLKTETRVATRNQARALEIELQKFSLLPLVLAENPFVLTALHAPELGAPEHMRLSEKLMSLAARTGAPYIYVIDESGTTIASSNVAEPDSFVGRRYEFRPYFRLAMQRGSAEYFAKGERTGKAGLFFARRVDDGERHLGVIVVKVEFADIVGIWQEQNAKTFVANEDNIILFSSDAQLNYLSFGALSDQRRSEIAKTMQFGDEPLAASALSVGEGSIGRDAQGRSILVEALALPELNWNIYRAVLIGPVLDAANARIRATLLSGALALFAVGLFVFWRLSIERQRTENTKLLETEVARQTEELSSANKQLESEIHKREEINRRFRKAREELAQANRLGSIGAITTSVAHEINQPVAAIHAFAESGTKLIQRKDYERADENLGAIVQLTTKIGAITAELRRYARRGGSVDRVALGTITVGDVVDGVELLIGDHLRATGVHFGITHRLNIDQRAKDPGDGHQESAGEWRALLVKADRVRLEQVIVNLLQNASEAVEGTKTPTIEMQISSNTEAVFIEISDNGDGIDESIESEIFTPFFTNKPHGLGIGLGIAKDIMHEFGGAIELSTTRLGGASFRLRLQKV